MNIHTGTLNMSDAQALTLIEAQAYKINQKVYEAKYPDWEFGRLIYVDTSGPEWSPGVLTFTSNQTGAADWQSGGANDVPRVDVNQDFQTKTFHLAAVGYGWNIEEVNTVLQVGGTLPDRKARAARLAYMQFMYRLTLFGDTKKGLGGLTNYSGVTTSVAPAGASTSTYWVDQNGVGQKTPAEIVRDINLGIMGINRDTYAIELADTILLPDEALTYIAQTPYSATTMETILSFVMKNNLYTLRTGRPLTIRSVIELGNAGTGAAAGKGRMVVYKNDEEYVKLHLPMPHRFLPVREDGALGWIVPGIFRTGGVEMLTTKTVRYIDGISEPPIV